MNLTIVSHQVRKTITILLLLLAFYIVWLIASPVLKSAFYAVFPPKDLPNPNLGQLPPLIFEEKGIQGNPRFVLNTTNGRLPTGLPNKMTIYQFAKPQFSYEAAKSAERTASILGFTSEELISDLRGNLYQWRDRETGGILKIDTTTEELILETNLSGKSQYFQLGTISKGSAEAWAKQMLNNTGRLTDALYKQGTTEVHLARIQNSQLIEADQPFEAQLARVDFFRKVNEFPILGLDPQEGIINVTLRQPSKQLEALNYLIINYTQWEIIPSDPDPTKKTTYPIIDVARAWDLVSDKNAGVIVNVKPLEKDFFAQRTSVRVDQIFVDSIYLAYYETPQRQEVLQPIYVFEGSYNVGNRPGGDIVIYLPAITNQYIKPLETTETPTN